MIKDYLEYRRNKKIAKRELMKMTATILPKVNAIFNNKDNKRFADIITYIVQMKPEEIQAVVNNALLQTNNEIGE